MTRKKFIKTLMAMGVSRNTATASADAASRAGASLQKVAGRVWALHSMYVAEAINAKRWRQLFDHHLLTQAQMVPELRYIRPLAKKTRRPDGLRIDFAMVDEWSQPGGGRK